MPAFIHQIEDLPVMVHITDYYPGCRATKESPAEPEEVTWRLCWLSGEEVPDKVYAAISIAEIDEINKAALEVLQRQRQEDAYEAYCENKASHY